MHEAYAKGHGRLEIRRIEVWDVGQVKWPGLKQWGRIMRLRTDRVSKETTSEEVYFISSLGQSQATPAELLEYNQNHWGIENKLHRTKDTLLKEDASTLRTGNTPQAIAAMRNLTLHLLYQIHPSPIQAREIANHDINKLLQILGLFIT